MRKNRKKQQQYKGIDNNVLHNSKKERKQKIHYIIITQYVLHKDLIFGRDTTHSMALITI